MGQEGENTQNTTQKMTIAFAGGGTGGHIFPGLAVATELKTLGKERGIDITIIWLGNKQGMDCDIVTKCTDITKFYGIPSGKLRRYFSLQNIIDIFKIMAGLVVAFKILYKEKPILLFSKGGFVSVPPCIVAWCLRIPVFTHECDFTLGLATKINSIFAKKLLLSYKETEEQLSPKLKIKSMVTGNPVRKAFYTADRTRGLSFLGNEINYALPILLILGGSSGAHEINQIVFDDLEWLCTKFNLVHLTGQKDYKQAKMLKRQNYLIYDFIYEQMPDVVKAADIILCRSGANVIWENAVLTKPMLLIPLCGSGTRGDQVDNAKYFAQSGAAMILQKDNLTTENIRNALQRLTGPATKQVIRRKLLALLPESPSATKIAEAILCYLS